MNHKEFAGLVEKARDYIPVVTENSNKYLGEITHWVISPTPDYFDGGSGEPSFEICPANAEGQEGDALFIGSEWECYKMFVEMFGDETPVMRSSAYAYIY